MDLRRFLRQVGERSYQRSEECLRFQTRMRRQRALGLMCRRRGYDVAERTLARRSPKTARLPLSQIVLDSAFYRLSENNPGFPHRTRHDAHTREFVMCGFGSVAAAHGHYETNYFASSF